MYRLLKSLSLLPVGFLSLAADGQILLVVSNDFNTTTAQLQRFEKSGQSYRRVGKRISVNLGRSGLGWGVGADPFEHATGEPIKREGDGRAPAGIFALEQVFGYVPTLKTAMPYLHATPELICVDDVESEAYNRIIPLTVLQQPKSFERMRREDDLYKVGVTVAHNTQQQKGAGSCIFLHLQKGDNAPTAGCTSMKEAPLMEIIRWLDPTKKPLLVQVPKQYCKQVEKKFEGVTCSE